MKAVLKYVIPIDDEIMLELPVGAEVLCVQAQSERPCVWARVDLDEDRITQRHFKLRGTGHDATDAGEYIGTFQLRNGEFVGHLFAA